MKLSLLSLIFAILLVIASSMKLEGKDFGIFGPIFPIEEENLKSVLQAKANRLSQKEIQYRYQVIEKNIREDGHLFKKVPWIQEALQYHSFFYDPSIYLEEDITDNEGNLLFSKGMKVNPLEGLTLEGGLLFFDGNNPKHVIWAESHEGEFKWILVNGDPLKLQEETERPVFFDQSGFYSKKFQIKKIPCRITQSGKVLQIEEIPTNKGKL